MQPIKKDNQSALLYASSLFISTNNVNVSDFHIHRMILLLTPAPVKKFIS